MFKKQRGNKCMSLIIFFLSVVLIIMLVVTLNKVNVENIKLNDEINVLKSRNEILLIENSDMRDRNWNENNAKMKEGR